MATEESSEPPDFVVIGHLSIDVINGEQRPGGSALYSGITAARLGKRVGVVTALHGRLPVELNGIHVTGVKSDKPTSFEHLTTPRGRSLRLLSRAAPINEAAIPEFWRSASLVHLAPIVDEVPSQLGACFAEAQVLATPQGWLRRWNAEGTVSAVPFPDASLSDLAVSAIVLSLEDLNGDAERPLDLTHRIRVVVLTMGEGGCRVYVDDEDRRIPSFRVESVDATGAGDVFAAAFLIRLDELRDPWEAARFASVAAALSLRGKGTSSVPGRLEVDRALRAWESAS